MKTVKLLAITLGMALAIASCTKTGPTGPAGATGATGPAGPTGATGPMGNANVKDTVISLTASDWSTYSAYDYDNITIPSITSAFLANGEIFVFMTGDAGATWDPLPITTLNPAGYTLNDWVKGGTNQLGLYMGPAANPNTVFSSATLQFRLVFVANSVMKKYPNTNWRDISQVNAVVMIEKSRL